MISKNGTYSKVPTEKIALVSIFLYKETPFSLYIKTYVFTNQNQIFHTKRLIHYRYELNLAPCVGRSSLWSKSKSVDGVVIVQHVQCLVQFKHIK